MTIINDNDYTSQQYLRMIIIYFYIKDKLVIFSKSGGGEYLRQDGFEMDGFALMDKNFNHSYFLAFI